MKLLYDKEYFWGGGGGEGFNFIFRICFSIFGVYIKKYERRIYGVIIRIEWCLD